MIMSDPVQDTTSTSSTDIGQTDTKVLDLKGDTYRDSRRRPQFHLSAGRGLSVALVSGYLLESVQLGQVIRRSMTSFEAYTRPWRSAPATRTGSPLPAQVRPRAATLDGRLRPAAAGRALRHSF
jgi:hypothetical protein